MHKNDNKYSVIFRVDGNEQIGLGHVTRCIALANIIKGNCLIIFVMKSPSDAIIQQVFYVCDHLLKITEEIDFFTILKKDYIIVIDGYHFKEKYFKAIKNIGCKLICLDDIHEEFFDADAIINHSPGVSSLEYKYSMYCKLCLGTEYAILRPPFLQSISTQREFDKISSILICFGGADIHNITLFALKAINKVPKIDIVRVIVGSAYKYLEQLKKFITTECVAKNVIIHIDLDAEEMLEVMKSCQFAIVPASGISLEVGCVGMGMMFGMTAINQFDLYNGLLSLNCGFAIVNYFDEDDTSLANKIKVYFESKDWKIHIQNQKLMMRKSLNNNLKQLFENLAVENDIKTKLASKDELMIYFKWVNDPDVRSNSINTADVRLEEHIKWFTERIRSDNSIMYYFEYKGEPLGHLRFDKEQDYFLVNYLVDKKFRGKGFGKIIMKMALERLYRKFNQNVKIRALVKKKNIASTKVFLGLGFINVGKIEINDVEYNEFVRENE